MEHISQNKKTNLMEKIVSLCKRRGFVFPGSEIYGGLANSWDYGHLGVELKNNIKNLWWRRFVQSRDDMVGLDAALIMNPKTWEASGHLNEFTDPLVECKNCHVRFRVNEHWSDKVWWDLARYLAQETLSAQDREDMVQEALKVCPNCGEKRKFTVPKNFNLMFKTYVGVAEGKADTVYLRPETAQAIFVDFKNILDTTRKQLPFGVGQVGKAFRNEITPGNFIFDFPFGRKELYGLAYRTDFDLKSHEKFSGRNLKYKDAETGEEFWPHVIEPSLGVDRSVLAVLIEAYDDSDPERIVLKLKPKLAPYKAAVFPLLKNKPELVKLARKIYDDLQKHFMVAWDDRGNIGKRYFSQDEIGTPYCITVDFDSLENPPVGGTVTIRDRDTMKQERVKIDKLGEILHKKVYE